MMSWSDDGSGESSASFRQTSPKAAFDALFTQFTPEDTAAAQAKARELATRGSILDLVDRRGGQLLPDWARPIAGASSSTSPMCASSRSSLVRRTCRRATPPARCCPIRDPIPRSAATTPRTSTAGTSTRATAVKTCALARRPGDGAADPVGLPANCPSPALPRWVGCCSNSAPRRSCVPRWNSAATRRSSSSTTPTSTRPSRVRSRPRCATWARRAPRPTGCTCSPRSSMSSDAAWPRGWRHCRWVGERTRASPSAPSSTTPRSARSSHSSPTPWSAARRCSPEDLRPAAMASSIRPPCSPVCQPTPRCAIRRSSVRWRR